MAPEATLLWNKDAPVTYTPSLESMCPSLGAPGRAAWEAECVRRKGDLRVESGVSQCPAPDELGQQALFHIGGGRLVGGME